MLDRIASEKETVGKMIKLYCRLNHGHREMCLECTGLLQYAIERLEECRYGNLKTACVVCPTHCYRKDMREKVRKVMRFSGPRMLIYHPLDLLRYQIRKIRSKFT